MTTTDNVSSKSADVFAKQPAVSLTNRSSTGASDIVSGALTYAMADFGVIKRRGVTSEQQHRDLAATHLIHRVLRPVCAQNRNLPASLHSS